MSDPTSSSNNASSPQPMAMSSPDGGNHAAGAAADVSEEVSMPPSSSLSTTTAPTSATLLTTNATPSNHLPSSSNTTNQDSGAATGAAAGGGPAIPSSTIPPLRESSTTSTGSTTHPVSTTNATTTRTVPTLKKTKKRVKDPAVNKETTNDPVKKKVRKVNRNSTGGAAAAAGRANHLPSSSSTNAGITTHPNHPNMPSIHHNGLIVHDSLSPAQQAAQEQMRRALEEDQYSLAGSIIIHHDPDHLDDDDDATDDGDHPYTNYTYHYRGSAVRLDKAAMIQAVRKYILLEQRLQQQQQHNLNGTAVNGILDDFNHDNDDDDDGNDGDDDFDEVYGTGEDDGDVDVAYGSNPTDTAGTSTRRSGAASGSGTNYANKTASGIGTNNNNNNNKKKKRKDELTQLQEDVKLQNQQPIASKDPLSLDPDDDLDRDGGSIFGATTGQSNSTWVECDKCKKWRRLRGVVDEKKLPSKWYCSMNKNDPERARCSAPEEEYETSHTPESAADSRTRKHLRVWVRRLQCNEAYESRQPTLTRGKKRNAVSSSSTNPYEWVRCCNPSCGKWRALLRIMDAKGNVVDRTTDGEWYCVMNNWDEKMASCAAPQENIPAIGCPPWVMQDGK